MLAELLEIRTLRTEADLHFAALVPSGESDVWVQIASIERLPPTREDLEVTFLPAVVTELDYAEDALTTEDLAIELRDLLLAICFRFPSTHPTQNIRLGGTLASGRATFTAAQNRLDTAEVVWGGGRTGSGQR